MTARFAQTNFFSKTSLFTRLMIKKVEMGFAILNLRIGKRVETAKFYVKKNEFYSL